MDDARAASSIRRRWLTVGIQVTAGVIATAALVLCVRTLATGWDSIRASLRHADLGAVAAALVCAVTAMLFMAVLWQQCLRTFGARYPLRRVMTWFFAGELGKYLPGGIWPVVGRAEFGRRQGLDRSVGYGTTMLSLGLMCIG
ncbi:MAG: lysylphosphatidylglycerol synthase domain-containing protein, partial [Nakamurella sp.]